MMKKEENEKFIISDVDYVEKWKEMEECVEMGINKRIGV
jgi:diketogulonate reductase-like aldo/keto reductase